MLTYHLPSDVQNLLSVSVVPAVHNFSPVRTLMLIALGIIVLSNVVVAAPPPAGVVVSFAAVNAIKLAVPAQLAKPEVWSGVGEVSVYWLSFGGIKVSVSRFAFLTAHSFTI